MNVYYLKKFRKEANQNLKLIELKRNLYYVGRVYCSWACSDTVFPKSNGLPYEEALKKLKELRRELILNKVFDMRLAKYKVVKHI